MDKRFISIVALFFTITLNAQQIDLADAALKGIELEYIGNVVQNKKVEFYSDITYWNRLGVRFRGWNGGTGGQTTPLPDGNVFWSFQDSYFGLVSENRTRKKKMNNVPRNAAMVQIGEDTGEDFITLNKYCSTALTQLDYYYMGYTWLRHPDAKLSNAMQKRGRTDQDFYYWPEDATVMSRNGSTFLQVMLSGYNADGDIIETSMAEYLVGDDPTQSEYLTFTQLQREVAPAIAQFGVAIQEEPDGVYIYGKVKNENGQGRIVVARTKKRDLLSPWEYYINDGEGNWQWQTEQPTDEQFAKSDIVGGNNVEHPSVFKYNEHYYMVTFNSPSGSMYMYQADNPWGPFGTRKRLYVFPSEQGAITHVVVHPQLSRMGEVVLSYNASPVASTVITRGANGEAIETVIEGIERNYGQWESADLCQLHFVRMFNWQLLYDEENTGPLTDSGLETFVTAIPDITVDEQPQMRLHYNATQRVVTLSTESADARLLRNPVEWTVSTLAGRRVFSHRSEGTLTLSLEQLPRGAYIVVARQGTEHAVAKIII